VSRRRLSEAAGLCDATVSASLHRLETAGLIRHLGRANDYGTHR
jgi:predicted transcriptional regulator